MNAGASAGRSPGSRQHPRIIPCEEQSPIDDIHFSEILDQDGNLRLNSEIEKGDFFAVSLKKGALSLRARGYIGYIPLTDKVVVYVQPRSRVKDLSRVIRLSGTPPTMLTSIRGYAEVAEWNESLLDVYAVALARHVEQIASRGLLREYVRHTEASSSPKGRILIGETFKSRTHGERRKVHTAWYDREVDNAPNRCIKYAIWLLSRRYRELKSPTSESRKAHRHLNALYPIFSGVTLDHSRRFLQAGEVTGATPLPSSRSYYRDALSVSSAAIRQRAVLLESPSGPVPLPSMVVNMDYVFEAYVRNVLRRYVDGRGLSISVMDGNLEGRRGLYDGMDLPGATPDIVVHRNDGTPPLVVEVKNVPVHGKASARDHVNQALTYALVYRAKQVLLVHPRASETEPGGLHRIGRVDSVDVYQYRFDLGADDLLTEDELFGRTIEQLTGPA